MPASFRRVLHPGPARHHGIAITIRLESQGRQQLLKQSLSGIQRPAQLEHQSGVDGVLAGGAPVNVARSLGILRFYLRRQLFHQRDGQITGSHRRLAQRGKIDCLVAAATIGPTASGGTIPQAACACASAASKSSMPCTRCASLNQSVSGLLRSIGVNKLILAP